MPGGGSENEGCRALSPNGPLDLTPSLQGLEVTAEGGEVARIRASGRLCGRCSLSTAGQLPYELTAVRTAGQELLQLKPEDIPAGIGKVAIKSQPPS